MTQNFPNKSLDSYLARRLKNSEEHKKEWHKIQVGIEAEEDILNLTDSDNNLK